MLDFRLRKKYRASANIIALIFTQNISEEDCSSENKIKIY